MAYMANQRDKINKFSGGDSGRVKKKVTSNSEVMKQDKTKSVKTPNTAVKKTSRPSVAAGAPKTAPKTNKKITVTGSATGTKSLTAAQVARFNKLTSKTKMGNR